MPRSVALPLLQCPHDFGDPRRLVCSEPTHVVEEYHANRRVLLREPYMEDGVCHRPCDEALTRLGCSEFDAVAGDAYSLVFDADAVRRRVVERADELFQVYLPPRRICAIEHALKGTARHTPPYPCPGLWGDGRGIGPLEVIRVLHIC